MLPGKQLRLCFSVSLSYQNFSAKPCSFYEGFVNVGKATAKQASRELSPRNLGASSSRPIACGNRVPPSDHSLEKLPAVLPIKLYSGAFMLSTMLMCRTWRRMAKHTTKVNSMVSAMLSR